MAKALALGVCALHFSSGSEVCTEVFKVVSGIHHATLESTVLMCANVNGNATV